MKRKQDTEREMLAKLAENIERLLSAAERLAGAADYNRRQIDRLAQLVNRVEDILLRANKPGITIENDDREDCTRDDANRQEPSCERGRPVNINPEDAAAEYSVDFGFGHFVEFSSYEELRKFQKLPPISGEDIELCDFDDVIRHLLSDDGQQ